MSASTGKNYHLYISLSPMHRGYPTLKQKQHRVIATNVSKASEPAAAISQAAEDDVCKKTYHDDGGGVGQTVISEYLKNLFINETHRAR